MQQNTHVVHRRLGASATELMQMEEPEHEEELIQSRVRHMVGSNHAAYERIWLNPGYVYRIQELERAVLRALVKTGHSKLENLKVLDIGCGTGH